MRKWDPLTPLLVSIVEDDLVRGISEIVMDGKLKLFKIPRSAKMPSHCFFEDDLMVYCNGINANLVA